MRSKHVIICGAGIIGLCCAYFLRRSGHEVTVVDRSPQNRDGCSFGNAGMIVPSHFTPLAAPGMVRLGLKWMLNPRSPFYIRPRLSRDLARWARHFMRAANAAHVERSAPLLRDLSLRSRTLYQELAAADAGEFGWVQRGLLMLCRTDQALHEEADVARRAQELGIPAEVVSRQRAAELDPGVRMDIAGGVYFPCDCHLSPQRLMAVLQSRLVMQGVHFLWSTEITGFRSAGGKLTAVVTRAGQRAGDEFVLAGGAWSPALVRDLALTLPMEPGKGYSVTVPESRLSPQLCSLLAEARVAVTPMGSSLRIGGTMELSGFDESIRVERVRGIVEAVSRYFPDFKIEDVRDLPVWKGFRPCSPDGLPYLGRFGRYPNLIAATGHAMMGLSLGPVTGELVSDLVSGRVPSVSLDLLNPDRFG